MPTVRYVFDLTRPHTHLIGVTMELPPHAEGHLDLVLPAWLPGAYKIFDNARNLRCFEPVTLGGEPLRFERVNWQTWRVHAGGQPFRVRYDVFANKPEIHQGQLDAHHAFLNPGVLALYADGHKEDWDCHLKVQLPEGWRVATGLTPVAADAFTAADYEEFIDCPLQVGDFEEVGFELDGVEYTIVYEGATPFDPAALVSPLRRVIRAATDLWGVPPITRYVFMYLETGADVLNGLEHRNSTIVTGPVTEPAMRDGLIAITTHEFFHLWNVKRLRPVGFGPFDYTREAHTTALWVAEGFTEYYTDLLVLRAGLNRPEGYFAHVASYIQQLLAMPGRRNMSLEEASWTTWHFGDDRWNGALNYYVKGYLLALALDLTLRGRSGNRVSLDAVMRELWARFGATDTPYEPRQVCEVAEELLGESLEDFWAPYLRGREDFDWEPILAHAGLVLLEHDPQPALEIQPAFKDGLCKLEGVLAGGAAQEAGLMIGDELVAIGGLRVTPQLLGLLGEAFEPGEEVQVFYFRRGRLAETVVTLARRASLAILPHPEADEEAKQLRASWLLPAKQGAAI